MQYDYGNARLRAMRAKLLTRAQFEALAGSASLPALVTALGATAYRKAAEAAAAQSAIGPTLINQLLRSHLTDTLGRVRTFYAGAAQRQVDRLLERFDVQNLKAIFHGLAQSIPTVEIESALIPAGRLTRPIFHALLQAGSVRAAIDQLATLGLPIAQPLIQRRAARPGIAVWELTNALDHWYHDLSRPPTPAPKLRDHLARDADIANLLTVLRFAHAPTARQRLDAPLESRFLPDGRLSHRLLLQAAQAPSVEDSLHILRNTAYAPSLNAGFALYRRTERLSAFERPLWHERLRQCAVCIANDPLGIGVPIGYLAFKTSEVTNLRHVAWGVHLARPATDIRAELEFV